MNRSRKEFIIDCVNRIFSQKNLTCGSAGEFKVLADEWQIKEKPKYLSPAPSFLVMQTLLEGWNNIPPTDTPSYNGLMMVVEGTV